MWAVEQSEKLRVVVLAGGESAEREISLASGAHCAEALRVAGHDAVCVDPLRVDLATFAWNRIDACFVALHGGAGEDGRIQRQLEELNVAYTGSGPEACQISMSKSASKERFREAGVPTPEYELLDIANVDLADVAARWQCPLVVKPDGQGSSLGVTIVDRADQFEEAIAQALGFDSRVLLESRVVGREFTVGLIDRDPLPIIEIAPTRGFFDYDAKYHASHPQYSSAPKLPRVLEERILAAAIGAAEALGARGVCRVDLMVDEAGCPWVLELNAVPGMTRKSLIPAAAARAGISMAALCDRLVRACLPARSLS